MFDFVTIGAEGEELFVSLGQTIARLRKQKQWKQTDLADKLGVHPHHVTRWETDRVRPRMKSIEQIADVFGVPLSELLAGELQAGGSPYVAVQDSELAELLGQVAKLEDQEVQALKVVLRGLLTRTHLQEMLHK